jgi:hypothetical protein
MSQIIFENQNISHLQFLMFQKQVCRLLSDQMTFFSVKKKNTKRKKEKNINKIESDSIDVEKQSGFRIRPQKEILPCKRLTETVKFR